MAASAIGERLGDLFVVIYILVILLLYPQKKNAGSAGHLVAGGWTNTSEAGRDLPARRQMLRALMSPQDESGATSCACFLGSLVKFIDEFASRGGPLGSMPTFWGDG